MRFDIEKLFFEYVLRLGVLGCCLGSIPNYALFGQEADTKEAPTNSPSKEEKAEADPFAVPQEATTTELFDWINKLKRTPPGKSPAETARLLFPAIIKACDQIIEASPSEDEFAKALTEKFTAYGILVRYSPEAKSELESLAQKYSSDERPAIAKIASGQVLIAKLAAVGTATAKDVQKLVDDSMAFIEKFGTDKSTFGIVTSIARSLGNTEHTEIAASMHEELGKRFAGSDDEMLQKRSRKLIGAARRLRLLGNDIELVGVTADEQNFDWSSYRGKVVLVDFWASWCGPCIGEIPNMKRNLERYREKGFEIVGINMDSNLDKFQKCVEDKEIDWVNIVSEEDGKTGWDAPIADYYGINAIPCAILVDAKGKVVSLNARGKELDRLLEEMLGG